MNNNSKRQKLLLAEGGSTGSSGYVVSRASDLTQELLADVQAHCESSGEKLRALKTLTDTSHADDILHAFIAAGGIELVAHWLVEAVTSEHEEVGIVLACLGCLEKLPVTVEVLQETRIAKILTENLKHCSSKVALERGRKLINTWKAMVAGQVAKFTKQTQDTVSRDQQVAQEPQSDTDLLQETTTSVMAVDEESVPSVPVPPVTGPPVSVVTPLELPLPVRSEESPPITSPALDALASLLLNLPDMDLDAKKKSIKWKSDAAIAQTVEFGISDTCLDLRHAIDSAAGKSTSLTHTEEEHKRFNESRKKERAMAGKGLGKMDDDQTEIDGCMNDDFEMVMQFAVWKLPRRLYIIDKEAVYVEKKLKSLERQDLANLHAGKKEAIYGGLMGVPDSPSEPSTSTKFYTSLNTTAPTVEVFPSGIKEGLDMDARYNAPKHIPPGVPLNAYVPIMIPPPMPSVNFEDEFVKLGSDVQTAIMNSEDVVRLFTQEPILLRDMTVEKINLILNNIRESQRAPPPQQQPPPPPRTNTVTDDRRSWGVSTIRSSVRNQVMHDLQHAPIQRPPPVGYPVSHPPYAQDTNAYYRPPSRPAFPQSAPPRPGIDFPVGPPPPLRPEQRYPHPPYLGPPRQY